jgi:hypothetical protein
LQPTRRASPRGRSRDPKIARRRKNRACRDETGANRARRFRSADLGGRLHNPVVRVVSATKQLHKRESAFLVLACFRTLPMSDVSTIETDLRFSGREDFWIIIPARSEDETEIQIGETAGGRRDQGHSARAARRAAPFAGLGSARRRARAFSTSFDATRFGRASPIPMRTIFASHLVTGRDGLRCGNLPIFRLFLRDSWRETGCPYPRRKTERKAERGKCDGRGPTAHGRLLVGASPAAAYETRRLSSGVKNSIINAMARVCNRFGAIAHHSATPGVISVSSSSPRP